MARAIPYAVVACLAWLSGCNQSAEADYPASHLVRLDQGDYGLVRDQLAGSFVGMEVNPGPWPIENAAGAGPAPLEGYGQVSRSGVSWVASGVLRFSDSAEAQAWASSNFTTNLCPAQAAAFVDGELVAFVRGYYDGHYDYGESRPTEYARDSVLELADRFDGPAFPPCIRAM